MELGLILSANGPSVTANQIQNGTPEVQAEIGIARRSRLWVAPEGIIFHVNVSGFDAAGPVSGSGYDEQFHDLYYFWNFGDSYDFVAPQNLIQGHRNSNVAYGPMASHTYRTVGTYAVSVLVVEPSSGKQATASLTVTVGNPEAMFPGANTIFVDTSNSGVGAPSGAVVVDNLDAAVAITRGQDAAPKRIMLKRGQFFAFSGTGMGLGPGSEWPSCHFVAEDSGGAKPVVVCAGGFYWSDTATSGSGADKDLVFQNIDFFGGYDSVSDTGAAFDMLAIFENAPNLLLLDGCLIDGVDHAIYSGAGANVAHRATILNDTTLTNFQAWGFADYDKSFTAITGCALRAHSDALVDSTPNMGAPLRSNGGTTIIHSSDLFSRQGWSDHGNYKATQPTARLNADGAANSKIICVANSMEGGHEVLQLKLSGVGTMHPVNALVEKNHILGTYQTYNMISVQAGGTTIRNNVMLWPDTGRLETTNEPTNFVAVDDSFGNSDNRATPISIYNNTMVNLLSAANSAGLAAAQTNGPAGFTRYVSANNVVYQPNVISPDIADAPLDGTVLWPPREIGYRSSTVLLQSQTATPADVVATYAPLPGSAALGDALNDPIAYDDFYGAERPQYPSRGAFETP